MKEVGQGANGKATQESGRSVAYGNFRRLSRKNSTKARKLAMIRFIARDLCLMNCVRRRTLATLPQIVAH
jgi:hypothetical protein